MSVSEFYYHQRMKKKIEMTKKCPNDPPQHRVKKAIFLPKNSESVILLYYVGVQFNQIYLCAGNFGAFEYYSEYFREPFFFFIFYTFAVHRRSVIADAI